MEGLNNKRETRRKEWIRIHREAVAHLRTSAGSLSPSLSTGPNPLLLFPQSTKIDTLMNLSQSTAAIYGKINASFFRNNNIKLGTICNKYDHSATNLDNGGKIAVLFLFFKLSEQITEK